MTILEKHRRSGGKAKKREPAIVGAYHPLTRLPGADGSEATLDPWLGLAAGIVKRAFLDLYYGGPGEQVEALIYLGTGECELMLEELGLGGDRRWAVLTDPGTRKRVNYYGKR